MKTVVLFSVDSGKALNMRPSDLLCVCLISPGPKPEVVGKLQGFQLFRAVQKLWGFQDLTLSINGHHEPIVHNLQPVELHHFGWGNIHAVIPGAWGD